MMDFTANFLTQFTRSVPLFILIGLGFYLSRSGKFSKEATSILTRFTFYVPLTAMLFRILSQMFTKENTADPKLMIAYFGACFLVFSVGLLFSRKILKVSAGEASIFGTGCVFANVGLLGLPLTQAMLGDEHIPAVATILSFNAMILWTLVSICIELSHGSGHLSVKSFVATLKNVFKNPLILSILAGVIWNLTEIRLPYCIDEPLRLLGNSATPLSLVVVGMGLAEYGIGAGMREGISITIIKLCIQPLVVFFLAQLINLGPIETAAVVFIGALPCGVNVYLMSRQFRLLEGAVANAMIISTAVASLTAPLVVTFLKH